MGNLPVMPDRKPVQGKPVNTVVWTTNSNLPKQNAPQTKEVSAQVTEQELTRIDHESHIETVCFCGDYFIKRLLAADKPFWAASSYNAKGPWQPFFCDQVIYDLVFQPEAAQS